jgi:two-component system NtrC family sensor kinase
MTALSQDELAELGRTIAELEQRLESSFAAHDEAIAATAEENARLKAELNTTRDRQRASAGILSTIANVSGDAERSLYQIAETSVHLFGATSATIQIAEGDGWDRIIRVGESSKRIGAAVPEAQLRVGGRNMPGTIVAENRQIHVPDLDNVDPSIADWPGLAPARAAGTRSMCGSPLRREGKAIGALIVYRDHLAPFTDEEMALQQSFADQAAIAFENARLFNETREALARQTATSEILRVISQSPTDVQPVFDAIVLTATRLFRRDLAFVLGCDATSYWPLATARPEGLLTTPQLESVAIDTDANFPSRVIVTGKNLHLPDWTAVELPEYERMVHDTLDINSALYLPLLREGKCVGVLGIAGTQAGIFSDSEIALAESFRDQALIAIENTRLFNETREALERQTATAEILKVIASSPSDVQPVFEAIATSANRLIGGFSTTVFRFIDGAQHLMAFTPTNAAADEALKASFPLPVARFPPFELVRDGAVVQFADTEAESGVPQVNRDIARLRGYRSMVFTPLMSNGASIGMISVTRKEPGTFAPHHVQLLQTFADQAVIAIENVRLFDEVQAKTADLGEALQQQTATADVLKVISRSVFDLQTVLDTLVESAYKLCGASVGLLYLRGDDAFECKAIAGVGVAEATQLFKGRPIRAGRGTAAERVILTGEVQSITDFLEDPEFDPKLKEFFRNTAGPESSINRIRSTLAVPMTRDGTVIGVVVIARPQTGPFPPRQIELLQSFADQAVIAIENARLFDEVKARTEDLSESLQQQTATADVLKVISRSAFDLQTVLDTLVESAARLCDADRACVFQRRGELYRWVSNYGFSDELTAYADEHPFTAGPHSTTSRVALEGKPIHNPDVLADPNYKASEYQRLGNYRTMLGIPLLREGAPIGVFILAREQVRPFTDRQIELVTSFADQAVIAIENVRLFDEVQARTMELAGSLDELRTAQDRLVQTEKLASLGQLTAGIAHEIKNPLNFVNNFAALSAELTDELNQLLAPATLDAGTREEVDEITHTLKSNLEKVVQHGKRADSIVKNMLLHSREGSGDHRPADINALLDESLNLAYHGARAEKREFNVTLRRDFDEMAGQIEVFPQEITRVFLNLISNGFYAVTKRKTENAGSGFEPELSAATKNLGESVEIRIRDNGVGIPADVREKMFNPFFTTKPAGEGTGLGLSMSHDIIVKQHGGSIDVTTEPGHFTEFRIVLPRTSNSSNKIRG